jgi:hypothetical protein
MDRMTRTLTALLLALTIVLAGCTNNDTPQDQAIVEQPVAPAPEPAPAPAPAPAPTTPAPRANAYGSDPTLDSLQDSCAAGVMESCDRLFWESPLGSEYEAFAQSKRYPLAAQDPPSSNIDMEVLMGLTWHETSEYQRQEFCMSYHFLGPDAAFHAFTEGYGPGGPSRDQFISFFDTNCAGYR